MSMCIAPVPQYKPISNFGHNKGSKLQLKAAQIKSDMKKRSMSIAENNIASHLALLQKHINSVAVQGPQESDKENESKKAVHNGEIVDIKSSSKIPSLDLGKVQ